MHYRVGLCLLCLGLTACQLDDKGHSVPMQKMSHALQALGAQASQSHRYHYAAEMYKRALRLTPDDIALKMRLAKAYSASGQYQKSIQLYHGLEKSERDTPRVRVRLAENYMAIQHYSQAGHLYERVLTTSDGQHIGALNGLGILLVRIGEPEAALGCLKKAVDRSQNKSTYMSNYLVALALSGRLKDAVTQMEHLTVEASNPRIQANYHLLKEVSGLAYEKKLSTKAWKRYMQERLFHDEKALRPWLYHRLKDQVGLLGQAWCVPKA